VSGQIHDPTSLHPRNGPRYPLGWRLGGSKGRSGNGAEENYSCIWWKSNPDHPASRQILSWQLSWVLYLKVLCF